MINFRKCLLVMFLFSNVVYTQQAFDKFISDSMFQTANISMLVRDMKTGKNLFSHRAMQAAIPASTMKVVTTASALEILGPDFRFETLLTFDGIIATDSTLNGNIYITGSGDPTLGSEKIGEADFLKEWVVAIKKAGIKKINGRIYSDDTRFDNEGANPQWTWDDIGNYYAPGIYGLAYQDNTIRITYKTGAVGTTPEIVSMFPEVRDLQIENNLKSGIIKYDSAFFYGAPKSLRRSVRGEIPANKPAFIVKAEMPDPGLQLASDLHNMLTKAGIQICNSPVDLQQSGINLSKLPARSKIYSHFSPPLSLIIKEINENSNNMFAEQLFKSLSLTKYPVAGNKLSIGIIRDFWKAKGLNLNQFFQEDGSGLSPKNAVSANFFVELLDYMYKKSAHKEVFMNSLSVGGKTGTLSGMFKKTPLEGKVFAKSGSFTRVRTYIGYIKNGHNNWEFAIMVNNPNGTLRQTQAKIEELLLELNKK